MPVNEEIVFYHNPMSRGRIAHWMLEEVGAPYRVELLQFEKGETKTPAFLALNPMGKIPTIVHRGVVVTEAAAICAYLADAFPQAALAPAHDDPARGTYYRWLFFAAGCIEPAMADKLSPRATPPRPQSVGYGSYGDTLNALEKAITPGPFILGERFSAADVYLGSALGYGLMIKGIEPRPSFTSYLARLSERPAYRRFSAQNDAFTAQLDK
ncbi:MAG: glutathione S-transferase [Myxococcaceae bacterium]|nr:glutathione S-transferase [Myxococcaceae bacterium]